MAWIYLLMAGMFEVAFALGLKYTDGFTRPAPSVLAAAAAAAGPLILSQTPRTLPVGAGYAMWTGAGAAGTALLGRWPSEGPRGGGCIGVIAGDIVGLGLTRPRRNDEDRLRARAQFVLRRAS